MPQKEIYLAIILATIISLLVVFFLVLFVLYFLKIKKQVFFESEILKREINETLIKSQLEIQEQTLQHISHELHDNLGQVASLIKINLHTIQFLNIDLAIEKIENTKKLTRQLIADIKSLSVSLGSDRIARQGLARAIETEVENLNKTGQFLAVYKEQGIVPEIPIDTSIILYRMVQEVLNNIVKHSQAPNIEVFLKASDNNITLIFSDDGIGFKLDEVSNGSGDGLRNLKRRAVHIKAKLSIESNVAKGTTVTINLPIQQL